MLGFRDVSYVWLLHRSMSQGDFPTYCHFGSLVFGDFGRNRSVRTNQQNIELHRQTGERKG